MAEMNKEQREAHVAALKVERAGYLRAGRKDRVADVDEQIKLHGGEVDDDKPKDRTAAKKATAG
jgi:hypothetical protein